MGGGRWGSSFLLAMKKCTAKFVVPRVNLEITAMKLESQVTDNFRIDQSLRELGIKSQSDVWIAANSHTDNSPLANPVRTTQST